MKVVYNWLKEFVDLTAPPPVLRERLSLAGVAIDSIEESVAGPVLDAEITANRPDCLGHAGIAREIAAIFRLPVKAVEPKLQESAEKAADATRVEIEAPELCGRYTARVLRGVRVQPSPDWLRQRLEAIGEKSINNVVDVTNYVMFELGQPLHAFDLDHLSERRIVVRRAHAGEKMRTLDGVERTLAKEMCVIADSSRAVAIAGVMGGADSEIRLGSRSILIESACFDPISIRRTSKALGLRTEASYRFERGADPEIAELASRRAAEFIAGRLYDPATGLLLRRYRQGEAAIPGFLDDYAMLAQGLLDLYEAQFDPRWLELALRLIEKARKLFEDSAAGGFFGSAPDSGLVIRVKEDYDGAEPSGNSVMAMNLLRLAAIANRPDLREAAEKTLAAFASRLAAAPVTLPQMLGALGFHLGERREIVVAGDRDGADTRALLGELHRHFVPNRIVLLVNSDEARRSLAAAHPAIAAMDKLNGRAAAYVCRNFVCQLPVSGPAELAKLLQ